MQCVRRKSDEAGFGEAARDVHDVRVEAAIFVHDQDGGAFGGERGWHDEVTAAFAMALALPFRSRTESDEAWAATSSSSAWLSVARNSSASPAAK